MPFPQIRNIIAAGRPLGHVALKIVPLSLARHAANAAGNTSNPARYEPGWTLEFCR